MSTTTAINQAADPSQCLCVLCGTVVAKVATDMQCEWTLIGKTDKTHEALCAGM